ncbi:MULTISPECIES: thioesterase family protein [Thermomonosporaceae]|uniref:thioesterase family protein n=1 Tax=Thermomonosporaceae TaxID=2012 RepID=UPI00255AAB85|nr:MULTISPECIES: thioesterase family protein [Thermomonosporaceae]MDL4776769.1 thioesterase family protein [Actinomadura xylanilytica]
MQQITEYLFDQDTRLTSAGVDIYAAQLTDRWNTASGNPNGGYLMAVGVRALQQHSKFGDPLVASAFFLRPGAPGTARIQVETARQGRRTSTSEARMHQDGKEILRVVATFADLDQSNGRTLSLAPMPDLPAPDELVDPLADVALPGITVADRVEYRATRPPGWLRGEPSGEPSMTFWMRFADGREPDLVSLPFLADAAYPAVMELGELPSATVELTIHLRNRPAPGWLACQINTRHLTGGFHEEDCDIWDSQGTLIAQSRQLALLP